MAVLVLVTVAVATAVARLKKVTQGNGASSGQGSLAVLTPAVCLADLPCLPPRTALRQSRLALAEATGDGHDERLFATGALALAARAFA